MLYDANNNPVQTQKESSPLQDLPLKNIPPPTPKPAWFDKRLNDIFGFVEDKPKYRVVWGMDPSLTHFAMGKIRMKYTTVVDTIEEILGYNLLNTNTGKHQYMKKAIAESRFLNRLTGLMTENVEPGVLIIPVIKKHEIEYGSPWWIAEQFVKPEAFGGEAQWERDRWMPNPENKLDYIDALGPYPSKGAYLHWFDIYDYDSDGKIIYKDLDESVIDLFHANHVFNIAMRKKDEFETVEMKKKKRDAERTAQWDSQRDIIAKEMLDIKKNRVIGLPDFMKG